MLHLGAKVVVHLLLHLPSLPRKISVFETVRLIPVVAKPLDNIHAEYALCAVHDDFFRLIRRRIFSQFFFRDADGIGYKTVRPVCLGAHIEKNVFVIA